MIKVKTAIEPELKRVFELNEMALDELSDHFPHSINISYANANIVKHWERAPCFLLKDGEDIVGFYGLMFSTPYCNPDPVLQDYMFYLLPKYRKLSNINLLTKSARDFSDSIGLPLFLNYQITKDLETQARLYKQSGFKINSITGVYSNE